MSVSSRHGALLALALTIALTLTIARLIVANPTVLASTGMECADYRRSAQLSSSVQFQADFEHSSIPMWCDGEHAYLAADSIYVIATPAGGPARKVGAFFNWGARDLTVRGDVLFCAMRNMGLWLYDVSNPGSPRGLAKLFYPASFQEFAYMGSLLLAAQDEGGLRVIDIEDPRNPQLLPDAGLEGSFSDLEVAGNTLLCQVRDAHGTRTQAYDLTDPAAPREGAVLEGATVFVGHSEGFLVAGESGFRLLDGSDAHTLRVLSEWNDDRHYTSLHPSGDRLLALGTDATGLRFRTLFDLSERAHPRVVTPEVGSLLTNGGTLAGTLLGSRYLDVRSWLTGWELRVFSGIGRQVIPIHEEVNIQPRTLVVRDSLLFARVEKELHLLGIQDDGTLRPLGQISVPGERFAVGTHTAIVVHGPAWSVGDTATLFELGAGPSVVPVDTLEIGEIRSLIGAVGDFYYFADPTRIRVLDARDPRKPRLTDFQTLLPGLLVGPRIDGERLLAAFDTSLQHGENTLALFDLADPLAPRLISSLGLGQVIVARLALEDGIAVLMTHDWYDRDAWRFRVLDLADPGNPQVLSDRPFDGRGAPGLRFLDGWLYLHGTGSYDSVTIYDLRDPAHILRYASSADLDPILAADGRFLFTVGDFLRVRPAACPPAALSAMSRLRAIQPASSDQVVSLEWEVGEVPYVQFEVWRSEDGVETRRGVLPPPLPGDSARFEDAAATRSTAATYRIIGLRDDGLFDQLGPVTVIASTSLDHQLHALPNPSRTGSVSFERLATGRAPATLTIVDALGREVTRIEGAIGQDGLERWSWDGRLARARAPRGVYFARVPGPPGHAASTLRFVR
ncbi:MAG: hypothetical protein IPK72_02625 [Candidatus Eisenbacteria bacterium]|nr:hypothetical protein [Candidatus Eisenbacteria bacterium]